MPRRTDANHAEIMQAAKQLGFSVADTHALGGGFPDLVLGLFDHNILVEVKTADGKLNDKEAIFRRGWKGRYEIVRQVIDLVRLREDIINERQEIPY